MLRLTCPLYHTWGLRVEYLLASHLPATGRVSGSLAPLLWHIMVLAFGYWQPLPAGLLASLFIQAYENASICCLFAARRARSL